MNLIAKIVLLFVLCGIRIRLSRSTVPFYPPLTLTSVNVSPEDVMFYLFTQNNPTVIQQLFVNNRNILRQSYFDARQPLKILIPGWNNNHLSPFSVLLRQGFLSQGKFNVIVVDWTNISKEEYTYAASRVKAVAFYITAMIDFLVAQGSNPREISVVGHSLGAHIAGLAAVQAKEKVGHVVGLDPAYPGFQEMGPEGCISINNAEYVEIIHTCGGGYGMLNRIGHADFYPNGGMIQPGGTPGNEAFVSHNRAYIYYAEALTTPLKWIAVLCGSSTDFADGKCNGNAVAAFPGSKPDFNKPHGTYYLRTSPRAPYGLGVDGTKAQGCTRM